MKEPTAWKQNGGGGDEDWKGGGRGWKGGGRKMYTVNQHLFAMTLFCNLLAINWFATTNFHK